MPRDLFEEDNGTDLFSDLSDKKGSNLPGNSRIPSIMDRLGFTGGQFKGPQQAMGEYLEEATDSPILKGIQGAQDAFERMYSGGKLPLNPQSEGSAYNVGKGIGNLGSFLMGGELLSPVAKGLPLVGKALGAETLPAGIVRRLMGGGIAGASENPEDREKGAALGATMSLAGEAIPLALKGLSQVSETINPYKFTKQLTDKIREVYSANKQEASDLYDPIHQMYGNEKIDIPKFGKNILRRFGPKIETMYNEFKENPTLGKAHSLQSQLGIESSALRPKGTEAYTRETIQSYDKARDQIKDSIETFLKTKGGNSADKYREASDIFKEKVAPFRMDKLIKSISEGKVKTVKPSKLHDSLNALSESESIPEGHFLSDALSQLSSKVKRGEGLGTAGSIAGGFAGGGVPGAIAGKVFAPAVVDLVTNPAISNILSKGKIPYDLLVKSIIANKLQGL